MSDLNSHRKVYARGYFDALRSMGIESKGGTMQQVKADAIYNGMNGMLKKVYDAVPIENRWTAAQIFEEVRRHGSASDAKSVRGCLNSLIGMKLVREPSPGEFIREGVRTKQEKPKLVVSNTEQEAEVMPNQAKQAEYSPMDALSNLAARAIQMSEAMKMLSKDIETAALELAEKAEKNDNDTAKMRQLQALLKSLG